MNVRRLRAGDDLTAAVALLVRFFADEGFIADAARIARHAQVMAGLETCGLFVGEAAGEAVAVASVSLEFGIEFGWWAEMGDLYVVPQARGHGWSRRMTDAVESFLREKGAAGYQVTVTPYGETAHGLRDYYLNLGFAGDGRVILMKTLD